MGIESERLVFDYLSRVGDLAHSARMPAGERARLVSGLRGEIDRRRAEDGGQNKAAVKKMLDRLGKPEDVVAAHAGGSGAYTKPPAPEPAPEPAPAPEPEPAPAPELAPAPEPAAPDSGVTAPQAPVPPQPEAPRGAVPGPRTPRNTEQDEPGPDLTKSPPRNTGSPRAPTASSGTGRPTGTGAAPPHLAGVDELGPGESDPDWWRVDPSPYGDGGSSLGDGSLAGGAAGKESGETVPGFIGGIELPEVLRKPRDEQETDKEDAEPAGPSGTGPQPPAPKDVAGLRGALKAAALKRVKRGRGAGPAADAEPAAKPVGPGPRVGGVVELLAAALLVVGAAMGSLILLGLGWLTAWWSPKLTRTEAKWAAAGMPGLVLGGTVVWLWGRMDGKWGDPLGQGGEALQAAMSEAFPVLLRVAAFASAGFLVWRARRLAG